METTKTDIQLPITDVTLNTLLSIPLHGVFTVNYNDGTFRVVRVVGGWIYKIFGWDSEYQELVFESAVFIKEPAK